jgi:hypothetical protein
MTVYGLYVRDLDASDLVWFTIGQSLAPGHYVRGRHKTSSPDVYVAESIPALILAVGPLIEQAEKRAQSSLGAADLPRSAEERIANKMTEGLLQRLTETSSIWIADPDWVDELRPVMNAGG